MLTSVMNQHPEVIMRGQIFKDDPAYQRELESIGKLPFEGRLFDDGVDSRERFDSLRDRPAEREKRNAALVADSFFMAQQLHTLRAKAVGIKLHGGTLYPDEIEDAFLGGMDYRFIILRRENLLAAAISWYQARTTERWVARPGEKVTRLPIKMDLSALQWFVDKTRADVEDWRRLLTEHGRDYLELTYEDITAPGYDYAEIWEHLGVSFVAPPPPKTLKLIKQYDHITNLDAVRAHFADQHVGTL